MASNGGYIRICEDDGCDPVEVPLEADLTLLLPTLTAQFPKCTGLKYKSEDSGCFRGLRLVDDRIFPPNEGSWDDNLFYCVFPKDNKRKGDEDVEDTKFKMKCLEGRKCTDLVVLNLAWQTDETKLRNYFSQFGKLIMVQIKRDPTTGKSRGYGFIRFNEYAGQVLCLAERHMIDDRICDVRIPLSKQEGDRQEVGRKVHIGRLRDDIGAEAIRQHFSKYGRVVDVFIPRPFRSFAFVTFEDHDVASSLMGKEEEIDGCQVTVGSAVPKLPPQHRQNSTIKNGSAKMPVLPYSQMNNNQWGSPGLVDFAGWPSTFGMFPGPSPGGQRSSGPMNLNPAAAAAAATLAAQYTRAHQRQNAAGGMKNMMKMEDNDKNNAALATLNILNNPSVVAAIVSAAAGAVGAAPFLNSRPR